MNRSLRHTLLLPISFSLVLAAAWASISMGANTDRAADPYPQDAPKVWDRLFGERDAARLVELYAEDAISMPFDAPTIQGRKALQADFEKFFAANEGTRHETRVAEVLTGPGWAVERAEYTLTYTPKGTGRESVETGRHVVCRKEVAGRWLIAWELWNRDQAEP